ncbi:MAG: metallopeptidase family protein [Acidobacteriota bacterium]
MIDVDLSEFETLVARALDALPQQFAELLDNVVVVVEEEPTVDDLEDVGLAPHEGLELLGLYQGVPQPERGAEYSALPDRVAIYRRSILAICASREDVVAEVRDTVVHELGHHFGLTDEDMPY